MPSEIRFKCPCPNIGCPNPNKMRNWKHADPCKGELYLDKYGMINCKKCDSEHHILIANLNVVMKLIMEKQI